jgi:cytochrome c-type biogenesis protein CcsB
MALSIRFLIALSLMVISMSQAVANENISTAELEKIAVLDGGRYKPLHSFAWESVRSFYGKSKFKTEDGERISALDLVLNMASDPETWRHRKLLRIDYHDLKAELGFSKGEKYFSFDAITASPSFRSLVDAAKEEQKRTDSPGKMTSEVNVLYQRLVVVDELLSGYSFMMVPQSSNENDSWISPVQAAGDFGHNWNLMLAAWATSDPASFDSAVNNLKSAIRNTNPAKYPSLKSLEREIAYNRLQPFHKAWMLYTLLTLLALIGAAWKNKIYAWITCSTGIAGLLLHTTGLIQLTLITGRAPVSNLFESMVFIIWAMISIGIWFYFSSKKENYMLLIAGILGTLSMGYALDNTVDISINPLVPVLRSYWLNIHVTVITFSYGAFAVAAGLGHVYLARFAFAKNNVQALSKIDHIGLRTIQIGILTLTAGIILGAVWANESWGRYWGWDPKETWSLITLLFYIAIIHGRINGWISKRSNAILNIVGLAVVLMTYFGVNYYLSGLHSYASGNSAPFPPKLIVYVLLEIAFVIGTVTIGKKKLVSSSSE